MATLHIEHPTSDLDSWLGAFNQFADARRDAGVTAQRIHQPIDDDQYIVVQLDFDAVARRRRPTRKLVTLVGCAVSEGSATPVCKTPMWPTRCTATVP